MIKKIRISNFKSFKDIELELGKFNVLIGANGSGKSNFVQIFQFLIDMKNEGIKNAISRQGGVEYFRNLNIGSSKKFFLEILADSEEEFKEEGIDEMIYRLAIEFNKTGLGFDVIGPDVLPKNDKNKDIITEKKVPSKVIKKTNNKIKNTENVFTEILTEILRDVDVDEIIKYFLISYLANDISIYNFDPRLPKKAAPITGKAELEEDGSNLSIVLKNIIENKDKRRKLFNLVNYLLPFVSGINIEQLADKSLHLKLQETYFKDKYMPISLISEGTINAMALIIALYFEKKPISIIEEPEKNIHPHLISKVVDMMKDVSRRKQIIITTHSPEIVKYAGIENILLVSRDKDGFSFISRPEDKKEVKVFLKNELGIEDLYVENLL